MNEKEITTTGKMTGDLIGGFFLYGIIGGIIYSIVYALIVKSLFSGSPILTAITAVILQGITVYFVWKGSTASAFKKKTIYNNDVPTVMRNLIIFTIIICVISAAYNFIQVNSKIENELNSDPVLKLHESYMSLLYTAEEKAEYDIKKEEAISKAKTQLYIYLAVLEIGLLVVYLGVLPIEKKNILKYTVD